MREQFEALGRLDRLALQVPVDAFDRALQLAVGIRLHQAADGDLCGAGIGVAGGEQRRNALRLGGARKVDPRLLAAQADVAEDQVDLFALQDFERFVEIVDRRDDLITGVAERIFIVERGQRLVLDDQDPLDDLLPSPEQIPYSGL